MKFKIESINLKENFFKDYKNANGELFLDKMAKINVFVGANNSSKSRFTRTLFSNDELKYNYTGSKISEIDNIFYELQKEIESYFDQRSILKHHNSNVIQILNYKPIKYYKKEIKSLLEFGILIETLAKSDNYGRVDFKTSSYTQNDYQAAEDLKVIGEKYSKLFKDLIPVEPEKPEFTQIYIPTLRGLRTIHNLNGKYTHENLYLKRTINDYFGNIEGITDKIYTGLGLYEDIKKLLLGTREERNRIRNFEEFLSKSFFNNQTVNIIPNQSDNVVHVLIGDNPEDEKPIYELGDGIQAIIILTYPLFFNQGKELKIFIEEPEHYLHPGFQRIFMETLVKPEFNSFQYFITTHSNHFLDITLDLEHISIYTFKRDLENRNFIIENVENEDSNILELLGARNASVFLSNCTIWVEGITDRIYIRKFLEVYQNSLTKGQRIFREDTHYSFVEYGGGNITHWSFLKASDSNVSNIEVKRLCGKLFLVSDKDGAGLKKDGTPNRSKAKKYERHLELEEALGERYYCLKSKEIENTLSPHVLKAIVENYEAKNPNIANLKFNKFAYEHYKDAGIGAFIQNNVEGINHKYEADSGTITDKVNFAKKAVQNISSFDDLTDDAKTLTIKIYDFIKSNN